MIKRIAIFAIELYQKTLSPDHGWLRVVAPTAGCRFYPSCSEYTKRAITKYGVFKGSRMGAWRILRCHPFSHGGHDPVK